MITTPRRMQAERGFMALNPSCGIKRVEIK